MDDYTKKGGWTGEPSDHGEMTIVAAPRKNERQPLHRRTAEFIPLSRQRAIGDATVPWRAKPRFGLSALKKKVQGVGLQLLTERFRPILLIFALAALCSIAAWKMHQDLAMPPTASVSRTARDVSKGPPDTASKSVQRSAPVVSGAISVTSKNLRATSVKSDATSVTSKNLKSAVDALAAGRFEDALAWYRKLLAAYPENRSFQLAVDILSRRLKENNP
ncbi:MAG: hypothetical protein QNJ97_12710 [Myxococcota bacterium]|nr:hypothetical protein [Myxococcota bacterium]